VDNGGYALSYLVLFRAKPILTWAPLAPITYGTPLSSVQAPTANTSGTWTYTPPINTVLNVGTYTLVAAFTPDDSTDYLTASVTNTLSVVPAKPTLTVTPINQSKIYGAPNPVLTWTATGFVNGDGPGVITGNPSLNPPATQCSPVGTYQITQGTLSAANYTISFGPATLTITPAPLTIIANNQTNAVGAAAPTGTCQATGFSAVGLMCGDTVSCVTLTSPCARATSPTTCSITPSAAVGTGLANYIISYTPGTLTVIPPVTPVATPTIQPGGGSYRDSVLVTLACATPAATIRYTTDGSEPTSSSTVYTNGYSIALTHSATLKAKGFAPGYNASRPAEADFTITHSVVGDFNGDGVPDIVLQDTNGFLSVWFMATNGVVQSTSFFNPSGTGDPAWRVVGCGNFKGDGANNLLFQYADGSLAAWTMDGTNMTSSAFLNPANHGVPDWKAVAVADFNKDGASDILFQASNGDLAIWYMNDLSLDAVHMVNPINPGPGWAAVGAADFNGDGKTDILFQYSDGSLAVWLLDDGNNLTLPKFLTPSTTGDPNWRVVGVTDLNGDGKPDLLFQYGTTGEVAIWFMNGLNLVQATVLPSLTPGGTWQVVSPR
jgi:hypothetical protein